MKNVRFVAVLLAMELAVTTAQANSIGRNPIIHAFMDEVLMSSETVESMQPAATMGKVIGVSDGDTVTVLDRTEQLRCRLFGIDAPEARQAWGQRSKQALSELVFGKTVAVTVVGLKDRYGRSICKLKRDGIDINRAMITNGFAWAYTRYYRGADYVSAEESARQARRGLWQDKDPVPPWDFRRN